MINSLQFYSHEKDFEIECGFIITKPVVAFHSWGVLNEKKDNVVLICHALTGTSDAEDWFSGFFKEGFFNPEKQFIICMNVLGGCYGTIGPQSVNPITKKKYKSDFPNVTIRDMVRLQQLTLDEFGVTGIELAIGGSMGGMQILEWAIMDNRIEKMIVIGAPARHSAWAIGIGEAQRNAIYADQNWNNGNYDADSFPVQGLASARMMGMLTYRTYLSFQKRFGRDKQHGVNEFAIESYLYYQGQKLVKRFDAMTYVRLTQAMDSHDITCKRGTMRAVLSQVKIPSLIIGIDSDILYPPVEQKEIAQFLPRGYYKEIKSIHGHDAFLIEFDQMIKLISPFLQVVEK